MKQLFMQSTTITIAISPVFPTSKEKVIIDYINSASITTRIPFLYILICRDFRFQFSFTKFNDVLTLI